MRQHLFKIFFLLAILIVGAVYSLPHLIRAQELAKQGKAYYAWTQAGDFDMFNVHAARYHGIIDGEGLFRYDDTFEHQGQPTPWPPLSAAIFAPVLWLTKSVSTTVVVTDPLFAMLIFLSFFLLLNSLTKSRYFSLWTSFILMLFPQLPLLLPPSSLAELKQLVSPLYNLTYLRREAFIPGAPFFILALYFIHRALITAKRRSLVILAGLGYGLLFYLYFYYWSFTSIVLGLLVAVLLADKQRKEALAVLKILVIGLVVSIPFWVNYYQLTQLPQYRELIERAGVEIGRGLRAGLWKTYILYGGLGVLILWFGGRINRRLSSIWLATLAFTQIIVLNLQLVTGFNIQSDHWSGRVFLIATGIVWAALFYYGALYLKRYWGQFNFKLTAGLAVLVSAALGLHLFYGLVAAEKAAAPRYAIEPGRQTAYEWMNKNLPAGSVVASPALPTNIDLPVLTSSRIFMARTQTSVASEAELLERLFITYKLFGISPDTLNEMLRTESGVIYFFVTRYADRALDRYLAPAGYGGLSIPDLLRERILDDYNNFKLPAQLPYRLDYLFVGPAERSLGITMSLFSSRRLLYESEGVSIYEFQPVSIR